MPNEHSEKILGLPVWAALAAIGAAGVIAYFVFFRNQGASQQGASTGYSSQGLAVMQNPDESATMALQNQELAQLGDQLSQGLSALNDQGTVLSTQVSGLGTQIGQVSGQVAGEQAAISGGFTQLGGQLGQIQSTQSSQGAQDAAYYSSLLNNLTAYANALSQQVQAGNTQAATQLSQTQNQINSIGKFLGWQFYQLPNRYTPLIPPNLNPSGWS